jgi:hypothetical protein
MFPFTPVVNSNKKKIKESYANKIDVILRVMHDGYNDEHYISLEILIGDII